MVSNARLDLPDPDRPVSTTNSPRGISTLMFFRLCSRAPRTRMKRVGSDMPAPEKAAPEADGQPPNVLREVANTARTIWEQESRLRRLAVSGAANDEQRRRHRLAAAMGASPKARGNHWFGRVGIQSGPEILNRANCRGYR